MKITFMGAGSTVFARNVLGDCMCTPALCRADIALYDIDEKRLEESKIILDAINKNVNEEGQISLPIWAWRTERRAAGCGFCSKCHPGGRL